ncbi:hypothetical protein YC2023_022244 [Brassica napus]
MEHTKYYSCEKPITTFKASDLLVESKSIRFWHDKEDGWGDDERDGIQRNGYERGMTRSVYLTSRYLHATPCRR